MNLVVFGQSHPHRGGRSSPVSDQVTAVTLLTLMDRRLSLSCFQAWPVFHSIFSHLPSVFKRDGLIFPGIQFLSVRLMLFLRPSAAFVNFPLTLVLSPVSQIVYILRDILQNPTLVLLYDLKFNEMKFITFFFFFF